MNETLTERFADALRGAADSLGPRGQLKTWEGGFAFRPVEAPAVYHIAERLLNMEPENRAEALRQLRAAAAQAANQHGVNLYA